MVSAMAGALCGVFETGEEPSPSRVSSSSQLSPHWHEASGSETQKKMLYSVALHRRLVGGDSHTRTSISRISPNSNHSILAKTKSVVSLSSDWPRVADAKEGLRSGDRRGKSNGNERVLPN